MNLIDRYKFMTNDVTDHAEMTSQDIPHISVNHNWLVAIGGSINSS